MDEFIDEQWRVKDEKLNPKMKKEEQNELVSDAENKATTWVNDMGI